MTDLKNCIEQLGFEQVQTYIQSGNIVFKSKLTNQKEIAQTIFNGLKKEFGYEVPNLILTIENLELAIANNPFKGIEKMYFTFLEGTPTQENIATLNQHNFEDEYFELIGQVVYFHCPNGAGRAKMGNNFFEQKLKVTATSRNLNTTKKLLEMAKFTASSNN